MPHPIHDTQSVSVTDSFDDEIQILHSVADEVVTLRFMNHEGTDGINMVFVTPEDTVDFLEALINALEAVWDPMTYKANTRR